ncbi:Sec62/63 complex, subunit Sec66 [Limtongia smithiae]|uniref:Sec62/63 complex, subunit Sec66 n=1 Tax=Limtongia smithiae TaxID=1125753 RepID=UPI0034CE8AC6
MGKVSLYAPIAYLGLLLTCLVLFSTVYRRRKVQRLIGLKPWFGEHTEREIYLSLKAQNAPRVPDKMLKAALMTRAAEDVRRIMTLQESKPALMELHQRGAVGDELWARFLAAEKVMDAEVMECAAEANALKAGWAQQLFQNAAEMVHNYRLRERLAKVPAEQAQAKERWAAESARAEAELEKTVAAEGAAEPKGKRRR